jgi:hypothetical protein
MASVIAKMELPAKKPDGTRIDVKVEVGAPYLDDSGLWRCPVSVAPLYGKLGDIAGEDSLQALALAMRLAFNLLADFRTKGGVLKCDLEAQFGMSGGNNA